MKQRKCYFCLLIKVKQSQKEIFKIIKHLSKKTYFLVRKKEVLNKTH